MSEPTGGAAPNPRDTPAGTNPAPANPAGNPTPASWLDALPDEFKGVAQNKGWKDPIDAVQAYANAQKLIGAPPESIVRLPKDDADEAALSEFYSKLGRPKEAKDYELAVPDGASPQFAEWAKSTFHGLGLSAKQGKALVEQWNGYMAEQQKVALEQYQASVDTDTAALKKEWGAAYDKQVAVAKRATAAFGIQAETIDKLEEAMGFAGLMKFMNTLGTKLGEDKFVDGGGSGADSGFGAITPAQAQAKLQELQLDKDFMAAWMDGSHPGHKAAVDRKASLMKMAYPA